MRTILEWFTTDLLLPVAMLCAGRGYARRAEGVNGNQRPDRISTGTTSLTNVPNWLGMSGNG
jgi:hypothetical protein